MSCVQYIGSQIYSCKLEKYYKDKNITFKNTITSHNNPLKLKGNANRISRVVFGGHAVPHSPLAEADSCEDQQSLSHAHDEKFIVSIKYHDIDIVSLDSKYTNLKNLRNFESNGNKYYDIQLLNLIPDGIIVFDGYDITFTITDNNGSIYEPVTWFVEYETFCDYSAVLTNTVMPYYSFYHQSYATNAKRDQIDIEMPLSSLVCEGVFISSSFPLDKFTITGSNYNNVYDRDTLNYLSSCNQDDKQIYFKKSTYDYYVSFSNMKYVGLIFYRLGEPTINLHFQVQNTTAIAYREHTENNITNITFVMLNAISFYHREEDNKMYGLYCPPLESIENKCQLIENLKNPKNLKNQWNELLESPCQKVSPELFIEGYYFSKYDQNTYKMPVPVPTSTPVSFDIIDLMEKYLINDCCYLGSSRCRICNKTNGSKETRITHNGIKFIVPEGYIHYVKDHNVHPSSNLIEYLKKIDVDPDNKVNIMYDYSTLISS